MARPTPVSDERFRCPKWNGWGDGDHFWHKRDGFRNCSHCGSIHPDDWTKVVRDSIRSEKLNIDRGKRGKWYVRGRDKDDDRKQGKFYAVHMPKEKWGDPTLNSELRQALSASWNRMFPVPSAVERLGDLVREEDQDG